MELPTYLSQVSPNTGEVGVNQRSPGSSARGTLLAGEALRQTAESLDSAAESQYQHEEHVKAVTLHQQNVINDLMEQKTAQVEALETNQKYSQLRIDWNKRLIEYQQNPTDDLLNTATKEYDTYVNKLLEDSSTGNIRSRLALHAANFRINFVNEAFRINSQQQLAKFGASFDQIMSNAEDSIFSVKSLGELTSQQQLLNQTVDDAVKTGQIKNPEIAQNLREKANLLSVSWAQANLPDNPELVTKVVKGEAPYKNVMKGVSVAQKEILLNKAQEVNRVQSNQEKLLLREALESDKVQRTKTGEGSALNLDRFEEVFGKPARDAAQRELDNATALHSFYERSLGASGEQLNDLLKDAQPTVDPKSPLFAEQQEFADHVQKIIKQAIDDKKNDAFTYFSQNPAIRDLVTNYTQNPSIETRQALTAGVLELQKEDKSLFPYEYKVMPKSEAEKFIAQFNGMVEVGNKSDGAGVRDLLVNFANQYPQTIHIALGQLSSTTGGDKVTPKLNPLMWHLNNPSTFRLIIDSIRKDPQEAYARFPTTKEKNNFLEEANLDKNLVNYQASLFSTDNSASTTKLVGGVRETFRDFSRDYVLNGGKLKEASDLFFSNYTWGSINGATYARPRVYTDAGNRPHVMSDDQVNLSNSYLEFYPQTLDPSKIAPETIVNQTKFFSSEQLTKDVADALKNNVFWSTTEDETGVYLFTKGSIAGTARQVFNKNGTPVRVNFIDTMKSIPAVPFGQKSHPRVTPQTGDSWLDRLANAMISSG